MKNNEIIEDTVPFTMFEKDVINKELGEEAINFFKEYKKCSFKEKINKAWKDLINYRYNKTIGNTTIITIQSKMNKDI